MKKERQLGIRVGMPAFFVLELEDVYRHAEGAHRALVFPDFVGLLVGMELEAYRKGNASTPEPKQEDIEDEEREGEPMPLFDIALDQFPDMFRDFDKAMNQQEVMPGLRLVRREGRHERYS